MYTSSKIVIILAFFTIFLFYNFFFLIKYFLQSIYLFIIFTIFFFLNLVVQLSTELTAFYATISKIHGVNFEIRVQTPGKLASAHPMPHEMIPAKK